jgi:gamma-glutamylcyclotransferase (GGCT)/AIG2-like uncharacterized protein YtfP
VYGSLKRGFRHYDLLQDARFLGEVTTAPGFYLVLLGGYPALTEGGSDSVRGELFEIASRSIERLDEFEGPEYARRLVPLDSGGTAEAYFVRTPTNGLLRFPGDVWDRR